MKKIIYVFCIVIIIISCIKSEKKVLKEYKTYQTVYKQKDFTIKFNFPDTLYRDSAYTGVISYNNKIDSINSSLDTYGNKLDDSISRKIDFIYTLGKNNLPFKDESLDKNNKELDTMYGIIKKSKNIFANKFIFNTLGNNYINGVIKDNIYINVGKGKLRNIKMEYKVIHKLHVIEK